MPTVDVKINNKTYNGVSVINFPLADGSGYAPFNLDSSHIVTKCSVTHNLTDVTSSNTVASIPSGSAYTTTLSTSLAGRVVSGVVVTMGGETLSNVYDASTGVISISEVTGNIVITATTAQDMNAPVFALTEPTTFDGTNTIETNLTPLDADRDITICADIETVSPVTGYVFVVSEQPAGNECYMHISKSNFGGIKFHDKSIGLGSNVWIGEKEGNTAKYVMTHAAGTNTFSVKGYAKNIKNVVSRVNTVSDAITLTTNTNKLKVGHDGVKVNSAYVYYRVLSSSEIDAYIGEA
jgi:hypothetical protein